MKTKLLNLLLPKAYIATRSGELVNVFDIRPEQIHIEDIAHALSMQCRFSGHTREFYSVAQHCVHCSELGEQHAFTCLMHDAAEAYLHDVASPIKRHFYLYKWMEKRLEKVIARKFGFAYPYPPEVHKIDKDMLHNEMCSFMHKRAKHYLELESWQPEQAKAEFIKAFHLLKDIR